MKPAVEYLEKLSGHAVLEHERELVAVAERTLEADPWDQDSWTRFGAT